MNWKDKEFILKAIKQDGRSFPYASPELKNDKEVEMISEQYYEIPKKYTSLRHFIPI